MICKLNKKILLKLNKLKIRCQEELDQLNERDEAIVLDSERETSTYRSNGIDKMDVICSSPIVLTKKHRREMGRGELNDGGESESSSASLLSIPSNE